MEIQILWDMVVKNRQIVDMQYAIINNMIKQLECLANGLSNKELIGECNSLQNKIDELQRENKRDDNVV